MGGGVLKAHYAGRNPRPKRGRMNGEPEHSTSSKLDNVFDRCRPAVSEKTGQGQEFFIKAFVHQTKQNPLLLVTEGNNTFCNIHEFDLFSTRT